MPSKVELSSVEAKATAILPWIELQTLCILWIFCGNKEEGWSMTLWIIVQRRELPKGFSVSESSYIHYCISKMISGGKKRLVPCCKCEASLYRCHKEPGVCFLTTCIFICTLQLFTSVAFVLPPWYFKNLHSSTFGGLTLFTVAVQSMNSWLSHICICL